MHARWALVAALVVLAGCSQGTLTLQVEGDAMLNALHDGDVIIVDREAYSADTPDRGDIVVYRIDLSTGRRGTSVKRVVGLAGETLEYRDCILYIDGVEVAEPYLDTVIVTIDKCGSSQPSIAIPDGFVFLMGDNRGGSRDSRRDGPVSFGDLVGQVID